MSPQESAHAPKPIPYIGLTQTCAQIRAEFRPMWLSSHQIPLECMATYVKAFFPVRLPSAASFEPDTLGPASLRVWIREHGRDDATQLFKFKARFPDCVVTLHSLAYEDKYLQDMNRIINYSSTLWRKSLSGRSRISQVRLGLWETVYMNVVVKEIHSEPWMKKLTYEATASELDSFKKRFGWDREAVDVQVKIHISVDYS
jgi:hypothetical protein